MTSLDDSRAFVSPPRGDGVRVIHEGGDLQEQEPPPPRSKEDATRKQIELWHRASRFPGSQMISFALHRLDPAHYRQVFFDENSRSWCFFRSPVDRIPLSVRKISCANTVTRNREWTEKFQVLDALSYHQSWAEQPSAASLWLLPFFIYRDAADTLYILEEHSEPFVFSEFERVDRIRAALSMVEAVIKLHNADVAHGNISLDTFVVKPAQPKVPLLSDFLQALGPHSRVTFPRGSSRHNPPEFFRTELDYEPWAATRDEKMRADIFMTAACVLEVLCIGTESPVNTTLSLNAELREALASCLQARNEDRPPTLNALRRALEVEMPVANAEGQVHFSPAQTDPSQAVTVPASEEPQPLLETTEVQSSVPPDSLPNPETGCQDSSAEVPIRPIESTVATSQPTMSIIAGAPRDLRDDISPSEPQKFFNSVLKNENVMPDSDPTLWRQLPLSLQWRLLSLIADVDLTVAITTDCFLCGTEASSKPFAAIREPNPVKATPPPLVCAMANLLPNRRRGFTFVKEWHTTVVRSGPPVANPTIEGPSVNLTAVTTAQWQCLAKSYGRQHLRCRRMTDITAINAALQIPRRLLIGLPRTVLFNRSAPSSSSAASSTDAPSVPIELSPGHATPDGVPWQCLTLIDIVERDGRKVWVLLDPVVRESDAVYVTVPSTNSRRSDTESKAMRFNSVRYLYEPTDKEKKYLTGSKEGNRVTLPIVEVFEIA